MGVIMETGDYIEQKNTESIALVMEQLKNKSFKVLVHDWRGRVVQQSTRGWYPAPVVITKDQVPEKIIKKIETCRLKKAIYG